jgi:predicted N-acetyltransferase YhbS
MENLIIRKADINDLKGIQNIHRNCDDPWHYEAECKAWIEKRIERSFYIQVAEYCNQIVGHGEWIISDEPDRKILYLGMLQIDSDFQRKGIGRKMLDDGIEYARKNNCSSIVTIPDTDTGSQTFYSKCGFTEQRHIKRCIIPVTPFNDLQNDKKQIKNIPFHVIKDLPFEFGLVQASSRHMWEVCNEMPATDDRLTPAILLNNDGYIQLCYFDNDDTALALYWGKLKDKDYVIKSILSFGYECHLKAITFVFYEENSYLFDKMKIENDNSEYIKLI